ncbi:hypothetical protein WA026_010368 [Henosepilachna vigintioctopunctata]|uniref:FUN14 domain-containing protein 1 n=1 Tax=Henosepilachna vigintioctopunctata TaxID=420089 RepID=A0AAW1V5D8_9CUCU
MDQSKSKPKSKFMENFISASNIMPMKKMSRDENVNTPYFDKVMAEIANATPARQMIFGISSGWVCGFFAMKVGRSSALALGGGIILLQIASDKGFININWDKVNRSIDNVSTTIEVASQKQASWISKLLKFAENNTTFTGGLIGGFLIGLASH